MKFLKLIITIWLSALPQLIYAQPSDSNLERKTSKFEPTEGKYLFFIGQDMGAIGGLDNYTNGYCDNFDIPTGFTLYTNTRNEGIETIFNWGAGDNCAQCILEDSDFKNSLVSIGLSLVNDEKEVANGKRDSYIKELGMWIKSLGKRPVFLRIGYEFDGWEWNHYNKRHYLKAWKRIYTIFNEMNVTNVALVWQSKGSGSNQGILEKWYPGDDLVDWCGYSHFGNPDEEMLTFARKHKKPVFIAEAAPVFEEGNLYFDTRLTNPKIAETAWTKWFVPFLETLYHNSDVIKAFGYINANWSAQSMWKTNPVFKKVDSRIQASDFISRKWKKEMAKPKYLKPNAKLWQRLNKHP